jgi:formate hydrogenlyase subunit 3/multisubunit Na+/H+ antiporter MnhD subunit
MISALLILLVSALLCAALGFLPRMTALARVPAVLGAAASVAVALLREGLQGNGLAGAVIPWPQALAWLGQPLYRSDTLSAGLGLWCLLAGGVCLLRIGEGENAPRQLATALLTLATLYSLTYTQHLLAFAGQVLLLSLLVWAYHAWDNPQQAQAGNGRYLAALGLGAITLLGAALLVGRTTGGAYYLADLSLSALTVWPLLLMALFAALWPGMAPFTGWSGQGHNGAHGALVQALVLGVPAITLLLRLEALITSQSLAGTIPPEWEGFTSALVWLGGVTSVVAAAGMVLWATTPRWTALLTAHTLGLAVWALGLDNPASRTAALSILLAFGAARVGMTLSPGLTSVQGWGKLPRLVAISSLAAVPLTPGFVGVWLLASSLAGTGHPSLAVLLLGAVILAACGIALRVVAPRPLDTPQAPYQQYLAWAGMAAGGALLLGGVLPGWWLPRVEAMAGIAGGAPPIALPWTGIQAGDGLLPLLLMAGGAALLAGIGWLAVSWARSGVSVSGVLLPTALDRLAKADQPPAGGGQKEAPLGGLLSNPPAAVWWLSLAWLESGIWGFGALLSRLSVRSGSLLARLEGRFYLPLALILTLIIILIVSR